MTNTNKLKGRITEKGYTLSEFSEIIGMSRPSMRKRINALADFKLSELERICEVLEISKAEIGEYFFLLTLYPIWVLFRFTDPQKTPCKGF